MNSYKKLVDNGRKEIPRLYAKYIKQGKELYEILFIFGDTHGYDEDSVADILSSELNINITEKDITAYKALEESFKEKNRDISSSKAKVIIAQ